MRPALLLLFLPLLAAVATLARAAPAPASVPAAAPATTSTLTSAPVPVSGEEEEEEKDAVRLAAADDGGGSVCQFDADCNNNGECVLVKTRAAPNGTMQCDCYSGYVSHGGGNCNYKRKKQLVAFLLAFFLGEFGADWFYLADGNPLYNFAGAMKLLGPVFCFFFFGAMFVYICQANEGAVAGYIFAILYMVGFYLHGVIATGIGSIKDGNGVEMESW